jgi:phosphoadenosine phosphosulfate reductase
MDEGAYAPVMKGASALAVGVLSAYPEIKKGEQVLLRCCGRIFAGGRAKMDASDMTAQSRRGSAVKVRWVIPEGKKHEKRRQATWEEVVNANTEVVERRVKEAIAFITEQVEKRGGNVAVSYSGGKDSLATLSLVLEAGIKPEMFFINTGIELPDTVKNAEMVARHFSLPLKVADAGDAFWRALEYFGPPGKDYRWCCKTCKLGPTVQIIKCDFEGEVLSFIGQRAYESQQRKEKGETWENPWTPGQHGASPIQHWSALHVWLYIFGRKLPYNPWYERGMERVGCFLCPTMDLGEAEILKTEYEGYAKWEEYLKDYFAERGMGDEWVKYGLWRWKRPPASVLKRLGEEGISIQIPKDAEAGSTSKLTPRKTENVLLAFDGDFDMERIAPFLNILSPLNEKEDGSLQLENTAAGLTLHPDGSIIAEDMEKPYKRDLRRLEELIYRAAECVGCGICPGRCPTGALDIEDWRIVIDVERCAHCSLCLDGPCPVVDFGHGM